MDGLYYTIRRLALPPRNYLGSDFVNYLKMMLSRRTRILVFVLGLVLLICGLSAIAYALWPLPDVSIEGILPATLLAPP